MWTIVNALGLLVALAVYLRARSLVRLTTLTAAWRWGGAAWLLWTAAWLAGADGFGVAAGIADRLWYAAAVLALCPLVAVLGARRPTTGVWSWFVVLPMVVVLAMPVWSALDEPASSRLRTETPMAVGYLFVLTMGAGNYFGTRLSLPVLLYAAAAALVVVPLSPAGEGIFAVESARQWATALMASALAVGLIVLRAVRGSLTPHTDRTEGLPAEAESADAARGDLRSNVSAGSGDPRRAPGAERLWLDFRDAFGIVWSKRLLDRFNRHAAEHNLAVRLELSGLVRLDEAGRRPPTDAELIEAFRWLLKRFVEPEWIEQRVGEPQGRMTDVRAGWALPTDQECSSPNVEMTNEQYPMTDGEEGQIPKP